MRGTLRRAGVHDLFWSVRPPSSLKFVKDFKRRSRSHGPECVFRRRNAPLEQRGHSRYDSFQRDEGAKPMSELRILATGLGFPEGPVAMPDGSVILTEI